MACLNNLILGILLSMNKYHSIPTARRYFNAHLAVAVDVFLRLYERPVALGLLSTEKTRKLL